ncbi:P-type conjugative transfer protein TrbG [Parachitinimonas caeni]|uniref:P-type conjugative transfer protein TrbG n=1 Tax=Parachitinimonas caeni TaxID=3031301 RepID=A0ABT7E2V7_9NEIS|nr:P-type conjugative transfer protein TrbG [Parachitinimonas caeni]MDK2126635.1 P-type conjugative transfer protein TrbG [Parachitinimonas caeni]
MSVKHSLLLSLLVATGPALAAGAGGQPAPSTPATPAPTVPAVPAANTAKDAAKDTGITPPLKLSNQLPAVTPPADCSAEAACEPQKHSKKKKKSQSGKSDDELAGTSISKPTRQALEKSQAWAENPHTAPGLSEGGAVVFNFGESAPTVVCAPLRICAVTLEPGEVVQGAPHVGDAVRWKISPATSGGDGEGQGKITHLIIKPTEAGLDTNLIVPTNRRTYHLRLVSSQRRYVSHISFAYPETSDRAWSRAAGRNGLSASGKAGNPDSDLPYLTMESLNFDFKIENKKGKPAFRPKRVLADGQHTYLVMNDNLSSELAPIIVAIDEAGNEQMINFRLKGNVFVLDGSYKRLAMMTGVGSDQQRVEISREVRCKRRGLFGICRDEKDDSNG